MDWDTTTTNKIDGLGIGKYSSSTFNDFPSRNSEDLFVVFQLIELKEHKNSLVLVLCCH